MRTLFLFLAINMITDIYAMEPQGSKLSSKSHKYLHISNRSSSVSPNNSPTRSPRESGTSISVPKKSSKQTKQHLELSDSHQSSIEQQLLRAIVENDTFKATSILYPDMNIADPFGKTLLIITIQNDNENLVKELLAQKGINVNKTDTWGNTPLHHAALRSNEYIINLLLRDYRVNSFLKNKNGCFAHQLIEKESKKNLSLKLSLFARSTLDSIVMQDLHTLHVMILDCNADSLNNAINMIKERIAHDHEHQQDYQALPDATKLPYYATNEFIRKMIIYRIQQEENVYKI